MPIATYDYHGPARRPRQQPPRVIVIHATRGPVAPELQYDATVNWCVRPSAAVVAKRRVQRWGPMADFVVGARGEVGQFGDYRTERANWAAGFGGSSRTTYGADEHAIAIECAQSSALEDYTGACVEAAAALCRGTLVPEFNIAVTLIDFWDQRRDTAVPSGFSGHDRCANGRRLGKTDPGPKWPWDAFLDLVRAPRIYVGATADTDARLATLTAQLRAHTHRPGPALVEA